MKLDKRFAHRYQFTASYALQSSQSIQDVTQNLDDYFATYGPDLPRHNLTLSGTVEVPGGFQLSVLSTFLRPVAPVINGFDNTGTNVSSGGYTPVVAVRTFSISAGLAASTFTPRHHGAARVFHHSGDAARRKGPSTRSSTSDLASTL